MNISALLIALLMLGGDQPQNPWIKKAPELIQRAEKDPSVKTLLAGFDAAWRADDWESGLKLVAATQKLGTGQAKLRGLVARALWRGGKLHEAEAEADKIPADTDDPIALAVLTTIQEARGDHERAAKTAERLTKFKELDVFELVALSYSLEGSGENHRVAELMRRAKAACKPDNGYPDIYIEDIIEGGAEFFDAVGEGPLNQVAKTGAAEMPVLQMINLPYCTATINGKGPYRLLVDTGGSTVLSLNQTIVEELGLKTYGSSSVRGVSGSQTSTSHLVEDLQVGDIRCTRVITRGMEFTPPLNTIADGILGTGLFARERMTLDFAKEQLRIERSSATPGPGTPLEIRLLGDAKIIGAITLEKQPAWSIFDSGADVAAISPKRLKALFPDKEFMELSATAGMGVGQGGGGTISISDGLDIEIAGRLFARRAAVGLSVLDTSFSPILGSQSDFLAGMAMFREMRSATVDYRRVKMWIDWLPGRD